MRGAVLLVALAAVAALSSCGVAGAPEPRRDAPEPGIHVSGDARLGVVGTL